MIQIEENMLVFHFLQKFNFYKKSEITTGLPKIVVYPTEKRSISTRST
jgi:hypothetical protein